MIMRTMIRAALTMPKLDRSI